MIDSFILSFCFRFDYVIGYIMTKPDRLPMYHRYMYEKYGIRYCTKEQFDKYWNGTAEDPGPEYVNQD